MNARFDSTLRRAAAGLVSAQTLADPAPPHAMDATVRVDDVYARAKSLSVAVQRSWTVARLRDAVAAQHADRPPRAAIRLVARGVELVTEDAPLAPLFQVRVRSSSPGRGLAGGEGTGSVEDDVPPTATLRRAAVAPRPS